jgi:hypothetical protein
VYECVTIAICFYRRKIRIVFSVLYKFCAVKSEFVHHLLVIYKVMDSLVYTCLNVGNIILKRTMFQHYLFIFYFLRSVIKQV